MSEFSEQNSREEQIVPPEEGSTVFSDPAVHASAGEPKKKKRLLTVIAAVLAVGVLAGGTVAVVKLIPEKEEKGETTSSLQTVSLLNGEADDLKSVTVQNENGEFQLYAETVKTESDTEDGEETETTSWYLKGVSREATGEYAVSNVASSAASLNAIRKITEKTEADCGLENPRATVTAKKTDGSSYTIKIGKESPDGVGVYLTLSTAEGIYLADNSVAADFLFDALDLADTSSVPGVPTGELDSKYLDDNQSLTTFDTLTLSGGNFPKSMVIVPNEAKELSSYVAYITLAPTKRIADNIDTIMTFFQNGVSCDGAYSYDISTSSRSSFGLNKPDFSLRVTIGKKTFSYDFKKQADGGIAVWYDGAVLIKKIAADSLDFLNSKPTDFYASWVCLEAINDLSSFTVKAREKTYTFGIVYDDSEEAEESYVITYEGKKLTAQNFQDFYQACISLSCADYTVETLSGEPDLTFVFTYSDKSKGKTTVEFRKASETKYQYRSNGIDMGKVTASSLNKLLKYLDRVIRDETIR